MRKTPRIDRNARLILQALFQIEAEKSGREEILISEEFRLNLGKAIGRIKGVRRSELDEVLRFLWGNIDARNLGQTFGP